MKQQLIPEIAVFVRVTELGAFTAVAEETGLTASGVSRIISRLEDGVGARLLHRTTRRLSLTPEGEIFLGHARTLLSVMELAEADVAKTMGRPRGIVRVNCGTAFAHHRLAPLLAEMFEDYPELGIDLTVNDRRIDPIAEQIDVTIRVGPLNDSDLIAIRLGTVRRIIAASPAYLSSRGTPETARDLKEHDCLLLNGFVRQATWPMFDDGKPLGIAVSGRVVSDSADALLQAAISGLGIIRLGDFLGTDALATGQLIPLLADCHDDDPQPITALVPPGRQAIPRVRAFVDFLKSRL